MPHKLSRHTILSIAPSTRGFGFAVLEDKALVDWGCKTVRGEKNAATLAKVRKLIGLYTPTMLVIQDYSARPTRRAERIRKLGIGMASWLRIASFHLGWSLTSRFNVYSSENAMPQSTRLRKYWCHGFRRNSLPSYLQSGSLGCLSILEWTCLMLSRSPWPKLALESRIAREPSSEPSPKRL